MLYEITKGLVLRETKYKDSDILLTILTEKLGPITAKARGVRRKNSRLRSGCQLLSYSEFTLYEHGSYYSINEAEPIRIFPYLRKDIELLSLGSYFAQIMETVSTAGQKDPELLALGLNCLYALDTLKKPQVLVKAVFELRLMCISGYAPMLEGCSRCGDASADIFLPLEGTLRCSVCCEMEQTKTIQISPGILAAMRYISTCEKRRLFQFTLPEQTMIALGEVTERFLLTQLDVTFPSLCFYKRLFPSTLNQHEENYE